MTGYLILTNGGKPTPFYINAMYMFTSLLMPKLNLALILNYINIKNKPCYFV